MAPTYPVQPTFSGGEASPSLYARVDLAKYNTFLRTARNTIVHPQGGISNRAGTKFVAEVKDSAKATRLVPFEFSTEQAYVIEFGDLYCRFYKDGAQIIKADPAAWETAKAYTIGDFVTESATKYYCIAAHTSDTFATDLAADKWVAQSVYEIPTPFAAADLRLLKFTQSADTLYIVHPDYAPKTLTRIAHDGWVLNDIAFSYGPFMGANTAPGKTLTSNAIVSGSAANKNISSVMAYTGGTFYPMGGGGGGGTTYKRILLETSTAHGLATGDRITISGLDGAMASTLNGNRYQVQVPNSTMVFLYYEGTTDFVYADFTTYTPGAGTLHTSGTATITASAPTFSEDHVGSLFKMSEDIPSNASSYTFTLTTQHSGSIRCGHDWSIITSGSWGGVLYVEVSRDGGTTWKTIRTIQSVSGDNVDTYGDTGYEQCLLRVSSAGGWSGTAVANFSAKPFTWSGYIKVVSVESQTSATATVLDFGEDKTGLSSTDPTANWAEGSWSVYNGFPACVMFYQDRLCFGNTEAEPHTFWASKTGDYTNFGMSNPLVDDDSISVQLPSNKVNAIRNMVTIGEVLALTSSSEWSIGAGSGTPLTPTSVTSRCHGYYGSSDVAPIIVGNRGIYIKPMGTVVQDIGYEYASDGFAGSNLSVLCSHLFSDYEVVDLAYQQEPDSLIWFVRDDGQLVSITYMKEQEVLAATRHDTDGKFKSVCSIPRPDLGYDEVWFVVERTIGEATKQYVEILQDRYASDEPEDQFFVDCGLTYSGEATTSISGLGHLEGKTVAVLADGNVVSGLTVASGAITLPSAASKVHVGLPYIADIETMNIEIPRADGVLQGRYVKVAEVTLRFLRSRGGRVGPDDGNLDDFPQRTEGLGRPIDLYTGDVHLVLASGYDEGGRIFIRQSDPLPITVLAVMPKVVMGGTAPL